MNERGRPKKNIYNQQLKQEFTKQYSDKPNVHRVCDSVFMSFCEAEETMGKDLCTMSEEEIAPLAAKLLGMAVSSRWFRARILKDYVKWCIENGVEGSRSDALNIKYDDATIMKYQTVKSPIQLKKYLDTIYDSDNDDQSIPSVEIMYKCHFWLAYAGMAERDIPLVKTDDVDLINMVVHYDGNEYPIYREALDIFRACSTLLELSHDHGIYTNVRGRGDGNNLTRGMNESLSAGVAKTNFCKKIKVKMNQGDTDIKLSYRRIWLSGVFYRVYQNEDIGIQPDFSNIDDMKNRDQRNFGVRTQELKIIRTRQIASEYLNDYHRWKLAHGI